MGHARDPEVAVRVPARGAHTALAGSARRTLQQILLSEGYATLLYVDEQGQPTERYPQNPNGAPLGIAGLTNSTGRVLGVMPHPDRSYLPTHMPDWRRAALDQGQLPNDGDGMIVFREMVKAAKAEA